MTLNQQKIKFKKNISFPDLIINQLKEYPTTTHLIYKIQKGSKNLFRNVNILNRIIKNIEYKFPKKEIYSKDETIKILLGINKEIQRFGLGRKKNIDCDDFSFIYIAVGEKLNLNLFGVYSPGHLFIRHDPDKKHDSLNPKNRINQNDFNWETTSAEIRSDEKYIVEDKIPKKLIERGIFMKNLTKLELIALAYNNKGDIFKNKKRYDLAIECYDKSIKLNPNDADAHSNKGDVLDNEGKYDLAIKEYDKAIIINPNRSQYHHNKKITLTKKRKISKKFIFF